MRPTVIVALATATGHAPTARAAVAGLLAAGDTEAVTVLAGRADLGGDTSDLLARAGRGGGVGVRALRHATDGGVLREASRGGVHARRAAAANANTDPADLERLAADPATRLQAVGNRSTPEDVRRKHLTDGDDVELLVHVATPTAAKAVRAGVVAMANRWMLERPESYGPAMLRGLLALPESDARTVEAARRLPGNIRWVRGHHSGFGGGAGDHPAVQMRTIEGGGDADAVADAVVAGRDAEPHVLAAAIGTVGTGLLTAGSDVGPYADTRIAATTWASAYAGDLLRTYAAHPSYRGRSITRAETPTVVEAAEKAAAALGDRADRWELFARLSGDGTYAEARNVLAAAETAAALAA